MSGSDNTPELAARMRPAPFRSRGEELLHTFANLLSELTMAVQLGDGRLAAFYAGELTRIYSAALENR